jgi:hypothetical protein
MRMTKVDPPTAADEAQIKKLKDEFFALRIEAKRKEADARARAFREAKQGETDARARFEESVSNQKKKRAALEKDMKELQSAGERSMKVSQKKVDSSLKKLDVKLKK